MSTTTEQGHGRSGRHVGASGASSALPHRTPPLLHRPGRAPTHRVRNVPGGVGHSSLGAFVPTRGHAVAVSSRRLTRWLPGGRLPAASGHRSCGREGGGGRCRSGPPSASPVLGTCSQRTVSPAGGRVRGAGRDRTDTPRPPDAPGTGRPPARGAIGRRARLVPGVAGPSGAGTVPYWSLSPGTSRRPAPCAGEPASCAPRGASACGQAGSAPAPCALPDLSGS